MILVLSGKSLCVTFGNLPCGWKTTGSWNDTPDSGILDSNDLIIALEALKNKNILLSYGYKKRIVELILEYLGRNKYVRYVNN